MSQGDGAWGQERGHSPCPCVPSPGLGGPWGQPHVLRCSPGVPAIRPTAWTTHSPHPWPTAPWSCCESSSRGSPHPEVTPRLPLASGCPQLRARPSCRSRPAPGALTLRPRLAFMVLIGAGAPRVYEAHMGPHGPFIRRLRGYRTSGLHRAFTTHGPTRALLFTPAAAGTSTLFGRREAPEPAAELWPVQGRDRSPWQTCSALSSPSAHGPCVSLVHACTRVCDVLGGVQRAHVARPGDLAQLRSSRGRTRVRVPHTW